MARENSVMVIYPLCILATSESNKTYRSFPLKKKCTHTHIHKHRYMHAHMQTHRHCLFQGVRKSPVTMTVLLGVKGTSCLKHLLILTQLIPRVQSLLELYNLRKAFPDYLINPLLQSIPPPSLACFSESIFNYLRITSTLILLF